MIAALRLLPYIASGLLVAALWWLWSDRAARLGEIDALQRQLLVAERVAEQAAQARDVARAEARRQARAASEYAALREALLKGGEDAPLPDWFREYLDRLFASP